MTSCSSRSRSARKRCRTASTRLPIAATSASIVPGIRPTCGQSRQRAAGVVNTEYCPFTTESAAAGALRDNGVSGLYRIGDCVAPPLVADVFFDGHRLAREIDIKNPAEALPFIREPRVTTTPSCAPVRGTPGRNGDVRQKVAQDRVESRPYAGPPELGDRRLTGPLSRAPRLPKADEQEDPWP